MSLVLWLAPVLVPLLSVVVVTTRPGPRTSWLLVAAPVPAAVLAVVGEAVPPPALPWLLLDVRLGADTIARVLLLLTAVVWAAAGAYARRDAELRGGYAALWLLSLAGNVGLLLATDVVTFYTCFVVMTLAAYGLVVQSRTEEVRRAGRIYMVLGIAGEVLLLAGVLLAAVQADSLRMDDLAASLAGSPQRDLLVALLFAGFGIKAGVFGLHVWLPLAHPAAPFAASAALSGAMIKAGLIGWLRLLPAGEVALQTWSTFVVALGLVTAFAGVAIGLTQRNPKVVLAYSSVSQMGFITVLVGVALGVPQAAPVAFAAAAVYALHHGVAKAVLFLGVGLLQRSAAGRRRRVLAAGMAIAALSLAGLPASSGAFAKTWMKQATDQAAGGMDVGLALSLAAAGTTLLMARLGAVLRSGTASGTGTDRLAPWALLVGAVAVLTAVVPARLFVELETPALTAVAVWETLWPVALGAAIALLVVRAAHRLQLPQAVPAVPPGDLVVVGERAARLVATAAAAVRPGAVTAYRNTRAGVRNTVLALGHQNGGLDRLEAGLTRWPVGGALIALTLLVVFQALRWTNA